MKIIEQMIAYLEDTDDAEVSPQSGGSWIPLALALVFAFVAALSLA